jgi:hypothetical protein
MGLLVITAAPENIGNIPSQEYTGNALTPSVSVNIGGDLVENTDYTVDYLNNIHQGTAMVIVTGKGNYTGTATAKFTITPANIAGTSLTLGKSSYAYDGKPKTPAVQKASTFFMRKNSLPNCGKNSLPPTSRRDCDVERRDARERHRLYRRLLKQCKRRYGHRHRDGQGQLHRNCH